MKKVKKKDRVLKFGLKVLFSSIALLLLVQIFKFYQNYQNTLQNNSSDQSSQQNEKDESNLLTWSDYINEEYSISFSYPYLLHEVVYEDAGEYDFFVVFEENQFSVEKGIAFGISGNGLEEEIKRIKDDISLQGESNIIKDESGMVIDGENSWILEFEPKDTALEKRAFLIIERGDHTYSFSTVSEQIIRLGESMQFLD
jgi:hypothetical protein